MLKIFREDVDNNTNYVILSTEGGAFVRYKGLSSQTGIFEASGRPSMIPRDSAEWATTSYIELVHVIQNDGYVGVLQGNFKSCLLYGTPILRTRVYFPKTVADYSKNYVIHVSLGEYFEGHYFRVYYRYHDGNSNIISIIRVEYHVEEPPTDSGPLLPELIDAREVQFRPYPPDYSLYPNISISGSIQYPINTVVDAVLNSSTFNNGVAAIAGDIAHDITENELSKLNEIYSSI